MAAPAPEYTAYIKDLVDYNGNIIYPRTKVEAIYDNDGNVLSIPKHFIINVTIDSEENYTADKTYAEILEAYNMGDMLYVNLYSYFLPLAAISDKMFGFAVNLLDGMMMVQFFASGAIVGNQMSFELIPQASESDAGKVLMVGNDGSAVWTAITNAEGVEY